MLTFIATQISAEKEKEELLKTFKALDADGNGVLTRDELKKGLKQLQGIVMNEDEIDELISKVDTNQSGNIDFSGKKKFFIFQIFSLCRVRGRCDQPGEALVQEEDRADLQDVRPRRKRVH